MSAAPGFNDDSLDLLRAFVEAEVEFVVVGAHAMAVHGVPLGAHSVGEEDFSSPGAVYQLGLPPRRIDLLTSLTGVDFDDAWAGRVELAVAGIKVPFLGRNALLRNKRATARDKESEPT